MVSTCPTRSILHGILATLFLALIAAAGADAQTALQSAIPPVMKATAIDVIVLSKHTRLVSQCAFSPDGRAVATVSLDSTVKIWDAKTGQLLKSYPCPLAFIGSVEFSPDGTKVMSSGDGFVREWTLTTDSERTTMLLPEAHFWSARYDRSGMRLLTTEDSTACIWDWHPNADTLLVTLLGHAGFIYGAVFGSDGTKALTWGSDETVRLWDATTGTELLKITNRWVNAVALSPDDRMIATMADSVYIWDAKTGEKIFSWLPPRDTAGGPISFDPTGRMLAAGLYTQRIWLLDVATWQPIWASDRTANHTLSLSFNPEGTAFATTTDGTLARIYHLDVSAAVEEHPAETFQLALSQSRPNPTHGMTLIPFELSAAGHATIAISDCLGREVVTAFDGDLDAGTHSIPFDASGLAAGAYFYTLRTSSGRTTGRMDVLR